MIFDNVWLGLSNSMGLAGTLLVSEISVAVKKRNRKITCICQLV